MHCTRSDNEHVCHQIVEHVGRILTRQGYTRQLLAPMRTVDLYTDGLRAQLDILIFRLILQLKMMHQWAMLTIRATHV